MKRHKTLELGREKVTKNDQTKNQNLTKIKKITLKPIFSKLDLRLVFRFDIMQHK